MAAQNFSIPTEIAVGVSLIGAGIWALKRSSAIESAEPICLGVGIVCGAAVAVGLPKPMLNVSAVSAWAGLSTMISVDLGASALLKFLRPQTPTSQMTPTTPSKTQMSDVVNRLETPERIKAESKEELKENWLREFDTAEVLLCQADYENAIIHFANAVIVYGDKTKLLKQIHPLLPEEHWIKLLHLIKAYTDRNSKLAKSTSTPAQPNLN